MSVDGSLKLEVYINYAGCCEEAFTFYEQHLGGSISSMLVHEQVPPHFPKEWKRPILHAIIDIGGNRIRGADIPGAEPMRSAYLTLTTDTAERADEIYELLTADGEIFMKMETTFFANRFAMFRDKFGTAWMLMHER